MFDQVLTTILQIVIVADILGLVAYFVLDALRPAAPAEVPLSAGGSSFFDRFSFRRRRAVAPASELEFDQLRRVLYSYR